MSVQQHPSSVVSPKARLGTNVVIGPYTVINEGVEIGDGTWIGPNVMLGGGTTIGKNCKIHHAAAVGGDPQDLKYRGEPTYLEVGDNTVIREFVTLNRGTGDGGKTVVGSHCFLMAYAHVAHDCIVGNHAILANCATLAGHVLIEDHVIIGGLTAVHQFCKVGEYAMVGGIFRVVKDVPPYVLAGQTPLVFEGLNYIGLRRKGFSQHSIDLIDQSYRTIYQSNLNVSQAVAQIRQQSDRSPEVEKILEFISTSKRGIIPGHSRK